MRLAIGTAALVIGLALYALAAMHVAVTLLPENIVLKTLYYLAAGLLWVWPAARVTRWIQRVTRAPTFPARDAGGSMG